MSNVLKIGLPSIHSRLHPKVMDILNLPYKENPYYLTHFSKSISLYFIRGWDIARMVEMGKLDIAFCGKDTIEELGIRVQIVENFKEFSSPIGLCKVKGRLYDKTRKVIIATEYPNLTKKYLGNLLEIVTIQVNGATEAYPHLPGIDAIVDIVETGKTLKCNNLYLDKILLKTYPCLIVRNGMLNASSYSIENISSLVERALKLDRVMDGEIENNP
jgi:ATP phosphoribosyltransferase